MKFNCKFREIVFSFLLFSSSLFVLYSFCSWIETDVLKTKPYFLQAAIDMPDNVFRQYYPNHTFAAKALINCMHYSKDLLVILFLFSSYFIYKLKIVENKKLFAVFMICLMLFSVEIVIKHFVDYKKIYGLKIQGVEIKNDLTLAQQTYADSSGIIRFLKDGKLPPGYAINKEGFRSVHEFDIPTIDSLKRNNKVIMIIGDSHAEGCCAEPRSKSFADLIDAEDGFVALNFGVGGTDPLQYRLIAEQYIPKLLPDLVIIAFCLGNDFMHYDRKPMPHKSLSFQTNYGWLNATLPETHPDFAPDKYFNGWEDAQIYYLENHTIAGKNISMFEKTLIIPSDLMSLIYFLPKAISKYFDFKKALSNYKENMFISYNIDSNIITYKHLSFIKDLCELKNIDFLLAGVPTIKNMNSNQDSVSERYQRILKDIELYYPKNFVRADFVSENNDHFNNDGHQKFASYLLSIIDE